jgi:hypothetical protein
MEGTPELIDQDGNCWHFDCWSRTANRKESLAVRADKLQPAKLPRCCCGWDGDEAHVCIDGSPLCPKCGDLIK